MKKLILVFILLISCFLLCVCFSESTDFSGLTDDELLEVYDGIKSEIMNRGIREEITLIEGPYVIGVNVASGRYKFAVASEIREQVLYCYFKNLDEYREALEIDTIGEFPSNTTLLFYPNERIEELKDGEAIIIYGGALKLIPDL